MTDLTDAVLLERWQRRRDAEAFTELVRRYSGMVVACCKRVLGDASLAEDVAQECFLALMQSGDRVRVSLGAWLHKIAVRRSIDRIKGDVRRRKRESDFAELLAAVARQELGQAELKIRKETAATVMIVSGGYPEEYQKGHEIKGLEEVSGAIVFHAGTRLADDGKVLTNGGRVLSVTAFGSDFQEALQNSYKNVSRIRFTDSYFRKDLGFDL